MKYRKLDAAGDYTFGKGSANFYVDSPDAVGQAVETRLRLMQGEWWLNIQEGCPYNAKIFGTGHQLEYDSAIQETILGTQGVKSIASYSSQPDQTNRKVYVQATINTIYGQTSINTQV